jgi:hypothetical protein
VKINAFNLSDLPAEGHLRYSVLVYESHDGANWAIAHVARNGLPLDDVPEILLTLIADAVYTLTDGDTEDERAEIVARAMSKLDAVFPPSDKPAP